MKIVPYICKNNKNMATTENFKKKQPFKSVEYFGKIEDVKSLNIEVFGYNHKKTANDLYKVLKDSGFFDKHPCFSIRVDTMDFHKTIK